MKRYESLGEDPALVMTTEAERRLTEREIFSVFEANEVIEDLYQKAEQQRNEAVHEYISDEETLGRKACFMAGMRCEVLAIEILQNAAPQDEELEEAFRRVEIEES